MFSMIRAVFLAWLLSAAPTLAAGWEKWEGCRLETTEYFDGDSFHVRKDGKDRIFRLYAVDTAETDNDFVQRVRQQQKYFGARKNDLLAAGEEAEELTGRLLQEPFTVETRWVDAKGNSSQPRYFAKITLADGTDLGLRLVRAGLARSYGMREGLPESYLRTLDRAQEEAKEAKVGLWVGKTKAAAPVVSQEKKKSPRDQSGPARSGGGLDTQSVFDSLQREAETGVE